MTVRYQNGLLIMSFSPHSLHLLKFIIPICLLIATGCYLSNSQSQTPIFSSISSYGSNLNHIYNVASSSQKSTFVQDALETEIDGPYNGTALSELCGRKEWTPGLIFKCDAPQGGIGNVRNVFLNCIRYAIEAGATSFIIPEIIARGAELTDLTTKTIVPFTYFFDQSFFTSSLAEACPQMKLIQDINDLWDVPSTARPVDLTPQDLSTSFLPDAPNVLAAPGTWSNSFRQFLSERPPFSAAKPIVINVGTPLLQFPLDYDDPIFAATFGRILRFREDTRRLASTVLYALDQKYHLDLNPATPGIAAGKFYGAHLRTAADATAGGWTPYSIQSTNYLSAAREDRLPLIYLTSGNPLDTANFTELAGAHSISVKTKTELLSSSPEFADELVEMAALTWDQQALIDWEVLLRCSVLGATWESSFGWNIALRRHVVVGGGTWVKKGGIMPEELLPPPPPPSPSFITSAPPAHYTPMIAEKINSFLPPEAYTSGVLTGSAVPPFPTTEPERRGNYRRRLEKRDEGAQAFRDSASVIFGGEGQGNYFELSMWP